MLDEMYFFINSKKFDDEMGPMNFLDEDFKFEIEEYDETCFGSLYVSIHDEVAEEEYWENNDERSDESSLFDYDFTTNSLYILFTDPKKFEEVFIEEYIKCEKKDDFEDFEDNINKRFEDIEIEDYCYIYTNSEEETSVRNNLFKTSEVEEIFKKKPGFENFPEYVDDQGGKHNVNWFDLEFSDDEVEFVTRYSDDSEVDCDDYEDDEDYEDDDCEEED